MIDKFEVGKTYRFRGSIEDVKYVLYGVVVSGMFNGHDRKVVAVKRIETEEDGKGYLVEFEPLKKNPKLWLSKEVAFSDIELQFIEEVIA